MAVSKEKLERANCRIGRFDCGWGARAETAVEVAERLQALNRKLAEIEPAHRELSLVFSARGGPGPILDMPLDELSSVIDKRARIDPPRPPAPVEDTGYHILAVADRMYVDPLRLTLTLHAGAFYERYEWNAADVDYHADHRVWRDPALRLAVVQAFVETLQPRWACAARQEGRNARNGHAYQPWLLWTTPGGKAPDWCLEHAGPPVEARPALGGELRIWSDPPALS